MHTASQIRLISAVTVRPKSLYEDVHASTGHPGYTGMQLHQKNTIGANYSDKDAASARGICQGCALESAHQYPTNQHYVKASTTNCWPGSWGVSDVRSPMRIPDRFLELMLRPCRCSWLR